MKNVSDLISHAARLAADGLTNGEIADELNVSRETASWLVSRSNADAAATRRPAAEPTDIHVDWSTIGRDGRRLTCLGRMLADLLEAESAAGSLTVGVEKAGTPVATTVAQELDTDLGTYTPRKCRWDDGDISQLSGSLSRNFAEIRDRTCYVVDDTITTGTTLSETVSAIEDADGDVAACAVLADKSDHAVLDDIPVYSLLDVTRVEAT